MNVVAYQPETPRWTGLLPAAADLAHRVKDTSFVPQAIRGDEAAIVAAIMYGDEIGLSPMTALATVAIIQGRPAVAAEAQRALIHAAGHEIWPGDDSTITKFTWFGRRHGSQQIARFQWTMDDAKRAGLAGKQNWRMYPRQMLSARASAELARAVFSDVIHGLAAAEEIEDIASPPDTDGEAPQEPGTRRRRTRKAPAPVVAPTPPATSHEPPEPALPEEEPPKMTDAQSRKLFALFNQHGMTDRDDRLDWTNQQLERTVISSSELTDIEATRLIETLERETPNPAQQTLEQPMISEANAEILQWMRREAKVADGWLRQKLQDVGAEFPDRGPIGLDTFKLLTRDQAEELRGQLNMAIDRRREREGDEEET